MSADFTPGPWQSMHDYTIEGATTIIANVDGEIHPDGTTSHTYDFICTCENEYGERLPNAQANARLIAAAPDLVAALERIARGEIEVFDEDTGGLVWSEMLYEEAREIAVTALAKARGDQ